MANLPGDSPALSTNLPSSLSNNPADGLAGLVNVSASGTISVSGPGAIGILAQSVGSGGGLVSDGNTIFAGSPNLNVNGSGGSGGRVIVATYGPVSATGANGIGIFAQSTGRTAKNDGQVSVTIASSVTGGGGQASSPNQAGSSAIQIDSPSGSNSGNGNQVTVNSGGSLTTVLGTAGTAILASGGGYANVTNNGTITGSIYLNGGSITNNGTFNPGPFVQGNLVNSGLVAVGGRSSVPPLRVVPSFATTTITGSFVQTPTGTLRVGVDFNTAHGDTLTVDGPAVVNGSVKVLPTSVLPRVQVPLITALGGITGQLAGVPSTLYAYDTQQSATQITVTARATGFAPPGLGITGAGLEIASHLQSVFDTATPVELGYLFRELGDLADARGSAYANALNQLAPGTMLAFASRRLAETQSFADGLLGCPDMLGPGAILTERGCGYFATVGRTARQDSGGGYPGFRLDDVSVRAGGQAAVAPGWLLGGAVAYDHGWLTGTGSAKGSSETGYLGGSLLHEIGPWQAGVAVFGSFGSTETTRVIGIPGLSSALQGSPGVDSVGGRARLAYTAAIKPFYVRPALNLDVIRVHSGSTRETGTGTLGLSLNSASQTTFAATPLVELGMRTELSRTSTLRSFLSLGVTVPSNHRWQQATRLEAAAPDVASFAASLPMSGTAARVGVGARLAIAERFELQAAYDGAFSGRVVSHAGTLAAAYRF